MEAELPEVPGYLFEPSLAGVLSLLLAVLLPLLVALVARASWSSVAKGVLLLAVATVKVFVETWLGHINDGTPFDLWLVVYGSVINFGIAVAAYFGLLKGSRTQAKALAVGDSKPLDTA